MYVSRHGACLEVDGDESELVHEVVDPEDDAHEQEDEAAEQQQDVHHAKPFLRPEIRGRLLNNYLALSKIELEFASMYER
jgi:hypothetical protein